MFNINESLVRDALKDIGLVSDFDTNTDHISVMLCDDDGENHQLVRIYIAAPNDMLYVRSSIHLRALEDNADLYYHLGDALETCARDGFETIVIHNGGAK